MNIRAIAHAVPSRRVTNDDLVERVASRNRAALSPSQLDELCTFLNLHLGRAGAMERYHRDAGESALDYGIAVGRQALERAGLSPASIDLLIYVGVGRGFVEPATANVFQHALQMHNATCFDILDACASWLRALDVARHMLRAGTYRHAMILNCEFNFQEYEPTALASPDEMEDLWAGYTVGEAATATIVSAAEEDTGYHVSFRNLGQHVPLCQIPLPHAAQFQNGDRRPDRPGMRFYAQPSPLAASAIREICRQYWDDPRFHDRHHDIVFGHSASVPVSRAIREKLRIEEGRHYELFPRFGNTVSAAIPLAMSLAQEEGRLLRGHRVLLVMGGAGITTALSTFVY